MDFFRMRVVESSFALIRKMFTNILDRESELEQQLDPITTQLYLRKGVIIAFMWGIAGSMNLSSRVKFS